MPDEDLGAVLSGQAASLPQTPGGGDYLHRREKMAITIAMTILLTFGFLMLLAVIAGLFLAYFKCPLCAQVKPDAIEVINLLGHIFGPLIGVIVGFYFGAEYLKPRN